METNSLMEVPDLIQLIRTVPHLAALRKALIKLKKLHPESYEILVDFYSSIPRGK